MIQNIVKRFAVLSIFLFSTLGLFVQAQNSTIPLSIAVTPGFGNTATSPTFDVILTVDKDPSALGNAIYQQNEMMLVTARPDIASYIYLFNIRATGEVDTILPNNFENVEFTAAGQSRVFPTSNRGYEFRIAGAQGSSFILAVATQLPLSPQLIQQISGQVARQTTNGFGQTTLNLTFPLITQAWAVRALPFTVGQPVVQPPPIVNQFGSLHVQTNIIGGRVVINNQQAGTTNNQGALDLGNLPVGTHSISIEAPAAGFLTYYGQFTIQPNQQSDVLVAF